MRNLKRVLSLALALVMVLGMMVITTSAAAYTDAEEITYTEAVEVMSAIGVINGMGDGTFAPKGTLTREQAAKILAYVCLGAEADDYLTGSAAPFTDVAATKWSAKYIAYCKNLGIIAGNGDGTFNPAGTLTTVQFAKMLLVAAGIDGTYTGSGWENNVKAAAEKAGIDVVTIDTTDITREEACALALAAMKVDTDSAEYWVVTKGEKTYEFDNLEDALLYSYLLGTDAPESKVDSSDSLLFKVHNVDYDSDIDAFGRPGDSYTGLVKANEDLYLFYADEALFTYVNEFDKDVIEGLDKAKYTGLNTADVWYNGGENELALSDLTYNNKAINGYTIELYATGKTITDIVVTESVAAVVGKITPAKGETPASISIEMVRPDTTGTLTVKDNDKSTTDVYDVLAAYEEKDVISIVVKSGWESAADDAACILAVEDVTAVEGKITKVTTTGKNCTTVITIGGTEYALNNMCKGGSALAVGTEGTLHLDAQGKGLSWADKSAPQTEAEVVYITAIYKVETSGTDEYGEPTGSTKYYAQCITQNGEIVNYETEDSTPRTVAGLREISFYEKKVGNAMVEYAKFAMPSAAAAANVTLTDKAVKIADNQYFTEDVKFIYVSGAKADVKVEVKEGVQALTAAPVEYVILGKATDVNKTVAVVFVEAEYVADTAVTVEGIVFANEGRNNSTTKVLYTEKGVDKTGYEHIVYIDGVKTTIITTSADALNGFITLTEVKDVAGVYTVAPKTAENLKAATAVTNMYNGLLTVGDVTDMSVVGATLIDVSGDKDVTDDATKLTTEYTVALVLAKDGKSIVTIYVTDYTKVEA